MSDDLVKQLRNKSNVFYEYVPWHAFDDKDLLDKAADMIEELEAIVASMERDIHEMELNREERNER